MILWDELSTCTRWGVAPEAAKQETKTILTAINL